jgi:hypothetical protein
MTLLLLLIAPALVRLIAAAWSGRMVMVALIGLGSVPIVFVTWGYLAADTTRDCSDCGLYWGRYWEPYLSLMFGITGGLLWVLGAILGGGLRKLRASRPDRT